MPLIKITEIDQTSPGTNAESFEVVYVPGCVDTTQSSLYQTSVIEGTDKKVTKYVGLEKNKPTLFTSISAFESLCGQKGLTFENDFDYRALVSEDCSGFPADSIPFDRVMFKKDDIDPGYVLAKELLSAGLNVLFERVNPDVFVKAVPAQNVGSATDKSPYTVEAKVLQKISDASAPNIGYLSTLEDSEQSSSSQVDVSRGSEVVEFVLTNDTAPLTGVAYYEKFFDEDGNFTGDYVPVTPTIDKKFPSTGPYYTKGRNFYALATSDVSQNTVELVDVIEYVAEQPELNAEKTVYGLSEIPEKWQLQYYSNYYEISLQEIKVSDITTMSATFYTTYENSFCEVVKGVYVPEIYKALESVFAASDEGLADKGNYSIKYLTSGGYPVYEFNQNSLTTKMINLAETRGDCVAIIDHTDNIDREKNINLVGSLYHTVSNDVALQEGGEYATMFTPWATYNRTTVDKETNDKGVTVALTSEPFRMPASFAYLTSLADSIQTNAAWLAVAGAARGVVGNLASGGMTTDIPNGAADAMQPRQGIAVNAITNIKPYGYTIWGNRTLKKNQENLTATSFLNIRNLVSDVKKTCYRAARSLTFEQNTEVLWVNFKSKIAPTLDRMLSGYGISGYKIVRDTQHEKAAEKATICAKVILYPVYAVEDFYITIILKDDEISVESAE